jgi:lipoprotein signal peptidase
MNKIFQSIDTILGGTVGNILDKFFPDKADKLRFETQIRESLYKELELVYKDVESARDMQEKALNQDDKFSKRFVYFLSALVMLNTILAGAMAFLVVFPMENKDLIAQYYNFSFLIGGAQMMRFFYGTITTKQ